MKSKKIRAWAVCGNFIGHSLNRPCVWLSGENRVWAICVNRDEALKAANGNRSRVRPCTITGTFTPAKKRKGANP